MVLLDADCRRLRYNVSARLRVRGRVRTTDEILGIRVTARGLTVHGVSLDGDVRTGLALAREATPRGRNQPRLVCSHELAQARGLRGGLFVPWGKPFTLGQMALSLSPAGGPPGSALVRLRAGGQDILDARAASWPGWPGLGAAVIPEVDVILVDASFSEVQAASVEALSAWLAALPAGTTLALADPLLGLPVAHLLSKAGRGPSPSPGLCRAWQRWNLAPLRSPSRRTAACLRLICQGEAEAAGAPFALVSPLDPRAGQPGVLAATRLAAGRHLADLVVQSGARTALAVGAGAQGLADRLAGTGIEVIALRPVLHQHLM